MPPGVMWAASAHTTSWWSYGQEGPLVVLPPSDSHSSLVNSHSRPSLLHADGAGGQTAMLVPLVPAPLQHILVMFGHPHLPVIQSAATRGQPCSFAWLWAHYLIPLCLSPPGLSTYSPRIGNVGVFFVLEQGKGHLVSSGCHQP